MLNRCSAAQSFGIETPSVRSYRWSPDRLAKSDNSGDWKVEFFIQQGAPESDESGHWIEVYLTP